MLPGESGEMRTGALGDSREVPETRGIPKGVLSVTGFILWAQLNFFPASKSPEAFKIVSNRKIAIETYSKVVFWGPELSFLAPKPGSHGDTQGICAGAEASPGNKASAIVGA